MTKPMTHLEAFCSDDAKRGRVWTCGKIEYKRGQTQWPEVMHREAGCSVWNNYPWQLAESTEPVHWADEPKTLTPQEALRALADGKTIDGGDVFVRLDTDSAQLVWNDKDDSKWTALGLMTFCGYRVAPDPSQPAEPRSEWNPLGKYEDIPQDIQEDIKTERGWAKHEPTKPPLKVVSTPVLPGSEEADAVVELLVQKHYDNAKREPLKVGDRVRRAPGCECHLEEGDSPCRVHGEDEEAEPQVEYPLNYGQALVALHDKEMIARHDMPGERGRLTDGELQWGTPNKWLSMRTFNFKDAKAARWRIVDGAK